MHALTPPPERPLREVRALYSATSVVVYQAYSAAIAVPALQAQHFVPPFTFDRMTWIKPSFLWMMYRSGWARKSGQEHILRITLRRSDFDWVLAHGVLSHFVPAIDDDAERWRVRLQASPVVVQWDPERDIGLQPLPYRTIQIGLRDSAVRRYARDSILAIDDVTSLAHAIHASAVGGDIEAARALLPEERAYPVPADVSQRLAVTI
jgi:hypothetical protein